MQNRVYFVSDSKHDTALYFFTLNMNMNSNSSFVWCDVFLSCRVMNYHYKYIYHRLNYSISQLDEIQREFLGNMSMLEKKILSGNICSLVLLKVIIISCSLVIFKVYILAKKITSSNIQNFISVVGV